MSGHPNFTLFTLIDKKKIYLNSFAAASISTCDEKIENHRMFVLKNTNPDSFKVQINDAINGTALEHPSGQLCFTWSDW